MQKLLIPLTTLVGEWKGGTQSIVFLVFGIVFALLSILCILWMTTCLRSIYDENIANQKNWFLKWMYKNKKLISIMVTLIVVVCAVVFFLAAFNIFPDITNQTS